MRKVFYFIIGGLIFYSCGQESSTEKGNPDKSNENETYIKSADKKKDNQEPKFSNAPKVKDTIPVHVFKTGETLWNLCRTYYGNRHYSSIIATYNGIENVNSIDNGTIIKIPPLENLLSDPKLRLDPIHHEIEKILQARELFMKHEKILSDKREDVERRAPIKLPKNIKEDIQMAVVLINEAITSLNKLDSDSIDVPLKTIGQLKSIASNLDNLSQGNHDGPYRYDLDMVHQRLIHAINNSITWVQNNYK